MKRKLVLSITLAVIIMAIGGGAWLWKTADSTHGKVPGSLEERQTKLPVARPVPTAIVQPLPKLLTREFPGKVRANRRVQLAFSVSGQLIELQALEGRLVRKGEVIARLDPRDYKNVLDVARAKYADAKQSFDRTKALHTQKVVSEAEYDRTKALFDMAAAELRIREKAMADTVLPAPFDGVIATRFVENHEHVKDKQTIVSIQDISRVEVVLQVPERLVARGAESLQNMKVRFDVDEGRWFDATLREFSAEADSITRTYKLVLGMVPPEDIKVLPGMTATVRAEVIRCEPIAKWTESLTFVPYGAVVNGQDGKAYVWLIGPKASAPRKVQVDVGEPREDGIEIRSGLHPGQRIAVAGLNALKETMIVRPMREGGEGLDG